MSLEPEQNHIVSVVTQIVKGEGSVGLAEAMKLKASIQALKDGGPDGRRGLALKIKKAMELLMVTGHG